MNIQQLRYVCEIVQRDLNISVAAKALNTSQSGVSKQIKQLEDELGIEIFERSRNRIAGVTPLGKRLVALARDILSQLAQIKSLSNDPETEGSGSLVVATSHTQAQYVLPNVIRQFAGQYPNVSLTLRHGDPEQIAAMLLTGEADLGVTTEVEQCGRGLAFLPCRRFERALIVPVGHPLLLLEKVTLADIAQYPLVTYEQAFTGRRIVVRAFERAGITPKLALSAIDADVIKTCVENKLGIAILSEVTFDPLRDLRLRTIPLGQLFEPSITSIVLRRQRNLRQYEYEFITLCSAEWTRVRIDKAIQR